MVVGYYTQGTPYEEEADLLRGSLEALGLDYELEAVTDGGSWEANTRQKADVLADFRDRLDGTLAYIDCDAFVHHDFTDYAGTFTRLGFDFGAHWFRGPSKGHSRSDVREKGWWMLSGTLLLGDTDGCRRLLAAWSALNDTWTSHGITDGGGQKNLWFTVTCMDDLKVDRLPGRMCYVFDKPWAYPDDEPCWIEHTIASRLYRGKRRVGSAKRRRRLDELWTKLDCAS